MYFAQPHCIKRGKALEMQGRPLKNVHLLIPVNVTYHGKRVLVDVIKLRVLRWRDHPGLSGWAQWNHKGPHKGKKKAEVAG